jgi:hypothetical protein
VTFYLDRYNNALEEIDPEVVSGFLTTTVVTIIDLNGWDRTRMRLL